MTREEAGECSVVARWLQEARETRGNWREMRKWMGGMGRCGSCIIDREVSWWSMERPCRCSEAISECRDGGRRERWKRRRTTCRRLAVKVQLCVISTTEVLPVVYSRLIQPKKQKGRSCPPPPLEAPPLSLSHLHSLLPKPSHAHPTPPMNTADSSRPPPVSPFTPDDDDPTPTLADILPSMQREHMNGLDGGSDDGFRYDGKDAQPPLKSFAADDDRDEDEGEQGYSAKLKQVLEGDTFSETGTERGTAEPEGTASHEQRQPGMNGKKETASPVCPVLPSETAVKLTRGAHRSLPPRPESPVPLTTNFLDSPTSRRTSAPAPPWALQGPSPPTRNAPPSTPPSPASAQPLPKPFLPPVRKTASFPPRHTTRLWNSPASEALPDDLHTASPHRLPPPH